MFCLQTNESTTYRSDQFRPGVISEYIQVEFSEKRDSILSVSYWSTYRSGNETEQTAVENLELKNTLGFTGEEHGLKGELKFNSDENWLPFRIVEGVFEIEHSNDSYQIFEPEE